jgi:UDP-glucose 4-epimerase
MRVTKLPHMVKHLAEEGEPLIVLDNLSAGHRDAILGGEFIHGDCGSREVLSSIFRKHTISAVMHLL